MQPKTLKPSPASYNSPVIRKQSRGMYNQLLKLPVHFADNMQDMVWPCKSTMSDCSHWSDYKVIQIEENKWEQQCKYANDTLLGGWLGSVWCGWPSRCRELIVGSSGLFRNHKAGEERLKWSYEIRNFLSIPCRLRDR